MFISNRNNKRKLARLLADTILEVGLKELKGCQKVLVAGRFHDSDISKSVTHEGIVDESDFKCNSMEADQLVCLHALKCPQATVVLHSPDTDIWNIIMPLVDKYPNKHIAVQTNISSRECSYIDMRQLNVAISCDPSFQRCNTEYMTKLCILHLDVTSHPSSNIMGKSPSLTHL